MRNYKLYIHPPMSKINIARRNANPIPTHKAKRKDVPPMYRENIGEIVLNVAAWAFFILFTLNCILFFAKVL